jgi:hypothetical protein
VTTEPPHVQSLREAAHAITAQGYHAVTFTGRGGSWELRHPDSCDWHDREECCPVWPAAQRTLTSKEYMAATYWCEIGDNGYLRTHGAIGAVPTFTAPAESVPWTMGDLRAWVKARGHVPDGQRLHARLPERPRSWARDGRWYINELYELGTDDPKDFL